MNVVHQLLEIIERDEMRVEEIERDTVKLTQELLEGETRKRFMTAAVNTVNAARLVQQMESQARIGASSRRRGRSSTSSRRSRPGRWQRRRKLEEVLRLAS